MSQGEINSNVLDLLEYIQDTITRAKSVPMSGKIMVDKKEMTEAIDQVINYLPDEFKKAKWVAIEKNRILTEAQREYDKAQKEYDKAQTTSAAIIKQNIENHDIVKDAKMRALEIVNTARREAKEMRLGAKEYSLDILAELDKEIESRKVELIRNLQESFKIAATEVENKFNTIGSTIKANIEELNDMKE
ncbi:MAG: ATPase [Clostridium sp.]|nr:ATPase [Clostridium sp.]MDY3827241.1 ATPase [Clostridium sp.]